MSVNFKIIHFIDVLLIFPYFCKQMIRILLSFFLLVFFCLGDVLSQELIENNAFKTGEVLKYKVYYSSPLGNFTAGEAILTIDEWKESNTSDNRSIFHITGVGNSKGVFDWFYKVRDRFETQIDQETLLPYLFVRRTHEGKYEYDDDVFFDRNNLVARSRRAEKPIPDDVHDIISAFYFMRTLNTDEFDDDSTFSINFYLDDSLYHSKIKFESRGSMKTVWGWIDCIKFSPKVATGEVFSKDYPMSIWVTDDENHLPIMAESKVVVGSIKMELIEFSGLKNQAVFEEGRRKKK